MAIKSKKVRILVSKEHKEKIKELEEYLQPEILNLIENGKWEEILDDIKKKLERMLDSPSSLKVITNLIKYSTDKENEKELNEIIEKNPKEIGYNYVKWTVLKDWKVELEIYGESEALKTIWAAIQCKRNELGNEFTPALKSFLDKIMTPNEKIDPFLQLGYYNIFIGYFG